MSLPVLLLTWSVVSTACSPMDQAKVADSRVVFDCLPSRSVQDLRAAVALMPRDLTYITFNDCNLTQFDFGFLAEFPDLTQLDVIRGSLTEFVGMPVVPNLQTVNVWSRDFRRWWGPSLTPKLERVALQYMPDDTVIDVILDSLLSYQSTLRRLHIDDSQVTRVPPKVNQFTSLDRFQFLENYQTTTLTAGTFPATFTPAEIYVSYCSITTIEADTFQGDFSGRQVSLTGSELTSFDENVFGPVLRSMYSGDNGGALYLERVGACDCGLAWLNRDNPQLLSYMYYAECYLQSSGWTAVKDLDPVFFTNCPATWLTTL